MATHVEVAAGFATSTAASAEAGRHASVVSQPDGEPAVSLPARGSASTPEQGGDAPRRASWSVGLVWLGVAGVSGGLLVSKNSAVQTGCPGKVCTPDGRAAINATKPLMVVNAVGWGVGLAGVGVGAVLVLTSKSGSPAAATTVGATVLPGGGGLSLAGSFR